VIISLQQGNPSVSPLKKEDESGIYVDVRELELARLVLATPVS
jgi:hypothetical protein